MHSANIKNLILCALCLFLISCTATLQHTELSPVERTNAGAIDVAQKSTNTHKLIGFGSITPLALPIAPVMLLGNPEEELMLQLKDGLEHAGYKVKVASNEADSRNNPTLSCNVNKMKFWNYTWFLPFIWNWGRIDATLAITSPNGKKLWEKTYLAKAKGFYSFNATVNRALTGLIDMMVNDLITDPPLLEVGTSAEARGH